MIRALTLSLVLCLAAGAADLPSVSLDAATWSCTDGASISAGVVSLQGAPKGYVRATLVLPGNVVAGKTIRFSAQVMTQDLKQGRAITYASPKLKVIGQKGKAAMAVNNFGCEEHAEWTPMDVQVTVPEDQEGPVTLEIGLQLCSGLLKARDVSIAAAKPWRWRVLDGDHKSYFDK